MLHSEILLTRELAFSNHGRFLKKHGMYSAALYYKNMNESIERRAARAARYNLENMPLPEYRDGQQLMVETPYGLHEKVVGDDANGYGLTVNAQGDPRFDEKKFEQLLPLCQNSVEKGIVESVRADCRAQHMDASRFRYNHGGVHNVPDMDFVLRHGVLAYRDKALAALEKAEDPEVRLFQEGILDVVAGIESFMQRYVDKLKARAASFTGSGEKLQRLIRALEKVPLHPAESFYEAFIACDAAMLLSGNFEPGRLDVFLYPYYQRDLEAGLTSPEEAYTLTRALFEDIERRNGHPGVTHVTIGGTLADGSPAYNPLTVIAIRAIGGLRTPNVSLRVRRDMPREVWDAFIENTRRGFAQPAIVNEELFLKQLTRDYRIPYEDAVDYVFGGCSEVLIQGKTMCDSTWVAYNMLDVFEHTLYNRFLDCDTFEAFYRCLQEDYRVTVREMARQINIRQQAMGNNSPQMLRTLFVADCIENAKSFTNGGVRYNFDATNIYAGTNAINSLYTVKQFYAGRLGDVDKETLLQALAANFEGYEALHARCKNVTKFGNYDEELNALAGEVTDLVFSEVMKQECYRQNAGYVGRFMPTVVLWVDWITCGERVGATPDGRVAGQATVDSCGPMQGTDTEGPTSVMGAALSLAQEKCAGTCVLNLRLDPANFRTAEGCAKVQQLFQAYFLQGGSQLQVNVVDPQRLIDAMKDPENHRDIIVRVGGFSDNFVMLSKAIQQEVLKRVQHTV